jgi:hypothetical protein
MNASRRARMWLSGGAGAVAIAILGSCSGAAPSDLLTPSSGASDDGSTGSDTPVEAGRRDTGTAVPESGGSNGGSGGGQGNCTAETCVNGCCDSNLRCVSGNDDAVCGGGGATCQDCTQQNGTCAAQTCTAGNSSGSSSSSSSSSSGGGCMPITCPTLNCIFSTPCCNAAGKCSCALGLNCP